MKFYATALLSLVAVVSTSLRAEDWLLVNSQHYAADPYLNEEAQIDSFYVDLDSIRVNGKYRHYKGKNVYTNAASGEVLDVYEFDYVYDCANRLRSVETGRGSYSDLVWFQDCEVAPPPDPNCRDPLFGLPCINCVNHYERELVCENY